MNKNKQPHIISITPIKKRPLRHAPNSQRFRPSPDEAPPIRPNKHIPSPGSAELSRQPLPPSPTTDEAGTSGGVSTTEASPKPTASFLAIPGKYTEGFKYVQPPDTMGAVGTKDLIAFTNRLVYVQKRNGHGEGFVDFDSFWKPLNVDAFDPVVVWDQNSQRFICCAVSNAKSKSSSVLIGVSTTSSASSDWMVNEMPVSDNETTNDYWADFPMLGYSKDKIVISCNMYEIGGDFHHGGFWVLDRAKFTDDYDLTGSYITCKYGGLYSARTLDAATTDVFLAKTEDPNVVYVYAITGTAENAPALNFRGSASAPSKWASAPKNSEEFLPQKGTDDKLSAGNTRALSVLCRNDSLYVAHNIFMPEGESPTRCSVMWWELDVSKAPPTCIQNGVYDDPNGAQFYAYPSIAANWNGDVLVGFSTFGEEQYPDAAYALHVATDPPGELRQHYTYKEGNGYYNGANNRPSEYAWGDYSSTVVDPHNDDEFWTIQEYALDDVSAGLYHAWSTYWAKVTPPVILGNRYLAWASADKHLNVATQTDEKTTLTETASNGPSLCVFNHLLYIAWTGADDDRHSLNLRASSDGVNFGEPIKLDAKSNVRPAMCVFNGMLYIAWSVPDGYHSLYLCASSDGVNFGEPISLGERSGVGPALCVFNDRLYIAWAGTDYRLNLMSSADGTSFEQKVTRNDLTPSGPALAVFGGKLYIAWTRLVYPDKSNPHLYLRASSDGLNFGEPIKLDETSFTGPSLLASDRLYIAWAGTDDRLNIMSSPDGTNFSREEILTEKSSHGPYLGLFRPA